MADERSTSQTSATEETTSSKALDQALALPVALYLIILTGLALYALTRLWPSPAGPGGEVPMSAATSIFGLDITLSSDVRLGMLVAIGGTIGALIHATRSLYQYFGNNEIVRNWLAMYLLLPFVGTMLAVVSYFVIRGGFFSSQVTLQDTNPFSFVAVGGLIGMFSEQAALKLKAVAETALTKPEPGKGELSTQRAFPPGPSQAQGT